MVTPNSQHRNNSVPSEHYMAEDEWNQKSFSPDNRVETQQGELNPRCNHTSPQRRSRDPSNHTPSEPVKVVPPGPTKRNGCSRSKSRYHMTEDAPNRESLLPLSQIQPQHPMQSSMSHPHPTQHNESSPSWNSARHFSPSLTSSRLSTPIQRCPSNDSGRISTAFSRMMQSPVSFTTASFNPKITDSFQRWMQGNDSAEHKDCWQCYCW